MTPQFKRVRKAFLKNVDFILLVPYLFDVTIPVLSRGLGLESSFSLDHINKLKKILSCEFRTAVYLAKMKNELTVLQWYSFNEETGLPVYSKTHFANSSAEKTLCGVRIPAGSAKEYHEPNRVDCKRCRKIWERIDAENYQKELNE